MLTLKRVPAAVATVGIGYGIAKYMRSQADQQHQHQQQNAHFSHQTAARQQSEEALMNAYGDRSTLAELEAAMKAYEEQRSQR